MLGETQAWKELSGNGEGEVLGQRRGANTIDDVEAATLGLSGLDHHGVLGLGTFK